MNRTRALLASFFTVRVALLAFGLGFAVLGLPKPASAESDITDDEIVDVTDEFCDPEEGDDCEVESVASILDSTTSTEIDTYYATFITPDLLDYDYYAYVEGYLYQDDVLVGDGSAFDDGSGEAELDGATAINVSGGADAYAAFADSYLYDADLDEYDFILETEADATLGPPDLTSVSPAYAYVGTSGTLTLGGDSLINPFGACDTTVSAVPATSGATGLTLTAGSFNPDQQSGTASFTATLTADTGLWDIGMGSCLGSTIYSTTTKGLFTVGDPTPSITSVSPSAWTAGQSYTVTITGSGFGSNPTLTVGGSGVTSSITSHSDTGGAGGAKITASITVGLCTPAETATITVTSTGYNGTGFTPAFGGQSASGSSTATVTPIAATTPTISFGGKNVTGLTSIVVVGQQISLTGTIPSPQSSCVESKSWSTPPGTAVGSATATTASGFTLGALPSSTGTSYGPYYWVYAGSFSMTFGYKMTNGLSSANASTTFTVKGGGTMANHPYSKVTIDGLQPCGGGTIEPVMVYGNITGTVCVANAGGTWGIYFVPSGAQSGGTYSYVQLLNTDTTVYTPATGTALTCTTSKGVDTSYPYKGIIPGTNPPQALDAPGVPLPSTYPTINRSFNATMFLVWTSSLAGSIPVPIGYQNWAFNGTAKCTTSCGTVANWTATTNGTPGPIGSFIPSTGTQTTDGYTTLKDGYPIWSNVATRTCN